MVPGINVPNGNAKERTKSRIQAESVVSTTDEMASVRRVILDIRSISGFVIVGSKETILGYDGGEHCGL